MSFPSQNLLKSQFTYRDPELNLNKHRNSNSKFNKLQNLFDKSPMVELPAWNKILLLNADAFNVLVPVYSNRNIKEIAELSIANLFILHQIWKINMNIIWIRVYNIRKTLMWIHDVLVHKIFRKFWISLFFLILEILIPYFFLDLGYLKNIKIKKYIYSNIVNLSTHINLNLRYFYTGRCCRKLCLRRNKLTYFLLYN